MLRIALQHLEIRWGTESRGTHDGHNAAERNAVPRDAAFDPPNASEQGWLQHLIFDSGNRFVPVTRWSQIEAGSLDQLPLRWKREGEHHWVGLKNLYLQKPSRPNLEGWFARLPIGQRLIFRVNTAVDYGRARNYYEHNLSIGWSEDGTLDLPLFREIDERALLY